MKQFAETDCSLQDGGSVIYGLQFKNGKIYYETTYLTLTNEGYSSTTDVVDKTREPISVINTYTTLDYTPIRVHKDMDLEDDYEIFNIITFWKNSNIIKNILTVVNFPSISDGYTVKAYDVNDSPKGENARIGSKNIIKVLNSANYTVAKFLAIVKGDANGDGIVEIYDAFTMIKDFLEFDDQYTELDYLIRDYNEDGQIGLYDAYFYMRDSLLK